MLRNMALTETLNNEENALWLNGDLLFLMSRGKFANVFGKTPCRNGKSRFCDIKSRKGLFQDGLLNQMPLVALTIQLARS